MHDHEYRWLVYNNDKKVYETQRRLGDRTTNYDHATSLFDTHFIIGFQLALTGVYCVLITEQPIKRVVGCHIS